MSRRGIRRFLQLPRTSRRIRADVDDELQFDIDMRTEELRRLGLSFQAARERAIAEFGDIDETRAYCGDLDMRHEASEHRADYLGDLRSDLLIAWRGMRRAPAFAAVVLLTLALGIGANTAIFSVIRRVLIAPLPYRAPEQLYRLYTTPAPGGDEDKLSAVELEGLAAESRLLSGVTWFGNYGAVTYTDGQTAEAWQIASVAPNFFDVLGVHPLLGRAISDDDAATGATPVIVLGYPLWQRVFGGDRGIIGRTVQLNNIAFTVIGVLPPAFVPPTFSADGLLPLNKTSVLRSARYSRARVWRAVARTKDGVSRERLESELSVLRAGIQGRYPEIKNAGVIRPIPLHGAMVGSARALLLLVMAGATLVLTIMCVNIAGLFQSRAMARRHELGIRVALGAGQGRLVRHVLAETGCYALLGGAAGVALGVGMKRLFMQVAGPMLPNMGEVRIEAGVLVLALLASLVCGVAFAVLPARLATRVNLRDDMAQSRSRSASHGRSHVRGTSILVATQIALAIVLVIGASLLTRTFVTLARTDFGYSTDERVLTFRVNLPTARYPRDAGAAFVRTYLERLRSLPGVSAVGLTAVSPWNGGLASVPVRIPGQPVDANTVRTVDLEIASDGFFEAIGIPLRAGRSFAPSDRVGGPPVVVVSQSVARRFWPNSNAVGSRLQLETGGSDSADVREVIGVVGDVRPQATEDPIATVYLPMWQTGSFSGEYMMRVRGDASAMVTEVKELLRGLDPQLPLLMPRTLHQVVRASLVRQQLAMALMAGFGGLALLLAALGVYSVMAYSVEGRTREFGVRSALGAQRQSIVLLVFRQGMAMAVAGTVAGMILALAATRFVATLLVGVSTHDALSFVVSPMLLIAVVLAACFVPAWRATRVSPVDALRVD